MRILKVYLIIVLIFTSSNLFQIQTTHACSFLAEVDNIVSFYDLDGVKLGEHKLEYFAVGGDCSIENAIFPTSSDMVYVQDEKDKIDIVDLSNDKWEVVTQYQVTNLWRPLNIYQNRVILNPNIEELIDKSNLEIILLDLSTKKETAFKINLDKEISQTFDNATLLQDRILITSNNNWISFFAQIQPENCIELCTEDVNFWLYRYNLQNGENTTYHGSLSNAYDYGFRDLVQFQISRDGRFAFVVEDYPYHKILSLELESNTIKEITQEISIRDKWIKGDSIYYIESENSVYTVGYLNFTSEVSETIIEFDEVFPNKIVVTDNYIIIVDTRATNGNFIDEVNIGITAFPIMISLIVLSAVIKRKTRRTKLRSIDFS